MTVSTTGGSSVVGYDPDDNLGFEDVDQSDIVIPRITIAHQEAEFVNSLSGERYSDLDVIILGQVKQRIMWAAETDEGDRPLCKSPDHENGFPSVSDDLPRDKRFPWVTSGLQMADFPADQGLNGLVTLPCANCLHKDWDNPKIPGRKKPLCDEQFTFPLMYSPEGSSDPDSFVTALFSVQRTGIKPAKTYVSGYAQTRTPMFRNFTKLSLLLQGKGTVTYSIPKFQRGAETDRDQWDNYAMQYRSARELIRMPPENYDAVPEDGDNTNSPAPVAVTVQSRPVVQKPVQKPAPKAAPKPDPVEDDPWAAGPQSAPVQPVQTVAPAVVHQEEEEDDEDLPF